MASPPPGDKRDPPGPGVASRFAPKVPQRRKPRTVATSAGPVSLEAQAEQKRAASASATAAASQFSHGSFSRRPMPPPGIWPHGASIAPVKVERGMASVPSFAGAPVGSRALEQEFAAPPPPPSTSRKKTSKQEPSKMSVTPIINECVEEDSSEGEAGALNYDIQESLLERGGDSVIFRAIALPKKGSSKLLPASQEATCAECGFPTDSVGHSIVPHASVSVDSFQSPCVQLPSRLPIVGLRGHGALDDDDACASQELDIPKGAAGILLKPDLRNLPDLENFGKLQVMKSGRVFLVLIDAEHGESYRFELTQGTNVVCLQQATVVGANHRDLVSLGLVSQQLCVMPCPSWKAV